MSFVSGLALPKNGARKIGKPRLISMSQKINTIIDFLCYNLILRYLDSWMGGSGGCDHCSSISTAWRSGVLFGSSMNRQWETWNGKGNQTYSKPLLQTRGRLGMANIPATTNKWLRQYILIAIFSIKKINEFFWLLIKLLLKLLFKLLFKWIFKILFKILSKL